MKTRKPTPPLRLVDAAFMAELAREDVAARSKAARPPMTRAADMALLARLDAIEAKLVRAPRGVRWHDLAGLMFVAGTAAHLGILTGSAFF